MKHGISLEPEAKRAYAEEMKASYKKFKQTDSGLSVFRINPFWQQELTLRPCETVVVKASVKLSALNLSKTRYLV
ncbi:hypothetical protein DPMN_081061 [Dreissena polymorpha]|uniref:Uncharacterized protein n=1 Tax=Dreissena polymorpha TaxID=45954 RepID=A0A9D4BFY4_DREPO|nr:hypothetical protein DPMN_081061 [Dreissena polymorpha]